MSHHRKKRQGGSGLVEATILFPIYIFLFVGAYDWGVYAHGLVSAESALRTAALYASSTAINATDSDAACRNVLGELRSTWNTSGITTCDALPVIVTLASAPGPDGRSAVSVSLTYQMPRVIPIPGVLQNQPVVRKAMILPVTG